MSWDEKKVVIDSPIKMADGYAVWGRNLIKELDRLGYDVRARRHWDHTDLTGVEPRIAQIVEADRACKAPDMPKVGFRLSNPESYEVCPTPFKIGAALFEFTRLPDSWATGSARANLIIAGSEWCRKLWLDAGVQVPVETNPLGADEEVFTYKERTVTDTPYTFVLSGTMSERKAPWLTWQAFRKVFGNRQDVRLIVKSPSWLPVGRGDHPREVPLDDTRITVINEVWSDAKMVELLHNADCFLYSTRSEGFGQSPVEAMCTGLPVICTAETGCSEFMYEAHSYPLRFDGWTEVPSHWGKIGAYGEPSFDHLCALMEHVESHREEAIAKGKLAAEFVRSKLTWKKHVERFIEIVNRYV